jgi:hypothetical protein
MPITGRKEKKRKKKRRASPCLDPPVGKPKYFDHSQPHLSMEVQNLRRKRKSGKSKTRV